MPFIFNSIQKKLWKPCKHCLKKKTDGYKQKSVTFYCMILTVMTNRVVIGYKTLSVT